MDKNEPLIDRLRKTEIADTLCGWTSIGEWYRENATSPFKDATNEEVLCWAALDLDVSLEHILTDTEMYIRNFARYDKERYIRHLVSLYTNEMYCGESGFVFRPRSEVEYFNSNIKQLVGGAIIYRIEADGTPRFLMLRIANTSKYVQTYHPGTLTFIQGHVTNIGPVWPAGTREFEARIRAVERYILLNIDKECREEIRVIHPKGFELSMRHLEEIPVVQDTVPHVIYLRTPGTTCKHIWVGYELNVNDLFDDPDDLLFDTGEPDKHSVEWMTPQEIIDEYMKGNGCPYVIDTLRSIHNTELMRAIIDSTKKFLEE